MLTRKVAPPPALTHAEATARQQEQRRQQFVEQEAQMEERRLARQAEQEAHQAWMAQVQEQRQRFLNGEDVKVQVPTLNDVFMTSRAEAVAEQAQLEAERQAMLSPRDIWLTTLSWQQRRQITTWERINGMPYPMP